MKTFVQLEEWEQAFPADIGDDEIEQRLVNLYLFSLNPAIVIWHETLGLDMNARADIVSESLAIGETYVFADMGFAFERADHAMLFKLAFGGDL